MTVLRINLAPVDIGLFVAYLALTLWIGGRMRRSAGNSETFLLGGRDLSLPLFVASLVATWYGGLLGVGEIVYRDGVVAWLIQGGFWYLSYLIFALVLAPRLRRSGLTTLPDQIGEFHGSTARVIALGLNFLNVVPVAYLLSLGLVLQLFTGWPLWLAVVAGTAVAVVYSILGGFRAVVYTDLLQFLLMCFGVALLMIWCVVGLGPGDYLVSRLPPTHLQPVGKMPLQELAVWFVIALSTLVDPNFYHRCFAARTPQVARRGILLAIGFWVLFDGCTTFTGLYARAALPQIDPRLAYPLLADSLLPAGVRGLFFVGLVATVMSTIDSYCFVGAMTVGHDLWRKTWHPQASEKQVVRSIRFGVLITATAAAALALVYGGSIKAVWKILGSLSSAAMLTPMLLGFSGWRPPGAGALSMVGGAVGTLGWALLQSQKVQWSMGLEPLIPGVALSVLLYAGRGMIGASSSGEQRNGPKD